MTYTVGNPTALLIERVFWLGLGGFLGVALITSLIRELSKRKNNTTTHSPKELKNIERKAIQQNSNQD